MSAQYFQQKSHQVPACHIREYPGSTVGQEDVLLVDVKQYTPHSQASVLPQDAITLIAAHANAYPKELYEPLWDELLARASQHGFTIRSIWIADTTNFGASGVLNEKKLSSDYSWMDHARDLLLLVNQFRDQMPRPLVGIGHSFGGCQITNLAYIHPRLFTDLILLDPIIQLTPPLLGLGHDPPGLLNFTLHAADVFSSRAAAATAMKASPEYKRFDPRVFDLMLTHGLRNLPTLLHPVLPEGCDPTDPPVTYTSSKHQSAWSQMRENFAARQPDGRLLIDRTTHADMDPLAAGIPFYRPEPTSTWRRLPSLRPAVLFLLAGRTFIKLDEIREGIRMVGTGVGGSGGVAEGRVDEVVLPHNGHLFPFEAVQGSADAIAAYLGRAMNRFRRDEDVWRNSQAGRTALDNVQVNETWKKLIKPPQDFKKPATYAKKAKM